MNQTLKDAVLLAQAGKYLTFKLEKETFGIEILKVQEIIGIIDVTNVPKTPDFVRGIISLRGQIIPVMDLRFKFGLEGKKNTDKTCIIIVQIKTKNRNVIMGSIVDQVSEVLEITENQIDPPPSLGQTVHIEFIMGIGKIDDKVIMLLNIDKVLSGKELGK